MSCPHVIQVAGKIAPFTIGGEAVERNGFQKRIISFFGATSFGHLLVIRPPCGEMATMDVKCCDAAISPLIAPITAGRLAIAMNRDRGHSDQLATI
jgi:hypothetical protein